MTANRSCVETLLAAFIAGLLAVGCGGMGPGGASGGTTPLPIPDEITRATYDDALRSYHALPPSSEERVELRARLLDYLAPELRSTVESSDYEDIVSRLGLVTSLYTPEDFSAGRLSDVLAPIAKRVLELGSPRGDEARVLSALLILRILEPNEEKYAQEYTTVAEWGRDARATIASPTERYGRLIEIWEEHARLTPSPEVLELLARLHVERRNAIVTMLGESGNFMAAGELAAPVLLRRAPLDVAGVYLAHGDINGAVQQVEAMGDVTGTEVRLLRLLEDARRDDEDGADATKEIADAYRQARPEVALGLCRGGLRRFPEDPRFPVCLALIAAAEDSLPDATAWYARAIELAPQDRRIYDEALQLLSALIERDLIDPDPSRARAVARDAERILTELNNRFPDAKPAVTPAQLDLLVGRLEMNAGNASEAERRFEKSLAADESSEALFELARLAERTGNPRRAIGLYKRALELRPAVDRKAMAERAEVSERLGDAYRDAGEVVQAERMYRSAIDLWDQVGQTMGGELGGYGTFRKAILLDRLGQESEAQKLFLEALDSAPEQRGLYAEVLSHLVVSKPDVDFATEIYRRAQRQLTLEPEWKVYFALWLTTIAARAGQPPPKEATTMLEDLSMSPAWWGRLARFGAGELPYDALLREADGIGEETEAHFYEGSRLLGAGDQAGAERLFRRVLSTNMVNFYEFRMAQELLTADSQPTTSSSAATP